jgi:hypothetical protein
VLKQNKNITTAAFPAIGVTFCSTTPGENIALLGGPFLKQNSEHAAISGSNKM